MRILMITYRLPVDLCSGDQLTIHHMLKFFSQRHEIVLATTASRAERARGLGLVAPYCERVEIVPLERWQSYRNCLGGLLSSDPLQIRYFRSLQLAERVKQLVTEEKFDVAYAYHLRSGQYLPPAGSCPRVLDLKPVQSLNLLRMKDHVRNRLKKKLYQIEYERVRQYEPRLVSAVDRCFVISDVDRDVLDPRKRANHIRINAHGLDCHKFTPDPAIAKEPNSLIFTGYMNYEPNADAAVYFCRDILPLIRQRVPTAKITIVGKNPKPEVAALAAIPGVTVTGFVDDLRPYMNRAQVALDPLRIGAGLQNKVLEGMSMAMPMVITSIANEGIRAEEGRHLFVGDTPETFADAVVTLLSDAKRREEMGRAAREFILENWPWEKHFIDLERMIVEVAEEGNGQSSAIKPASTSKPLAAEAQR